MLFLKMSVKKVKVKCSRLEDICRNLGLIGTFIILGASQLLKKNVFRFFLQPNVIFEKSVQLSTFRLFTILLICYLEHIFKTDSSPNF